MPSQNNNHYNLKHACELAVMAVLISGCIYGCSNDAAEAKYKKQQQRQEQYQKQQQKDNKNDVGLVKLAFNE